jgi:hypothetical protein
MGLRKPLYPLALVLLLTIAVAFPAPVFAAKSMLIQAALNPTVTEQGVTVAITGRVFDTANSSIPNAVVSIQVNNPQGTSVHLAVAYSDPNGLFQDTFFIALNSPGGNYTAFLVADKPGYDTAHLTLVFTYASPDFSIQISTSQLSLRQGETGMTQVTVLSLRGFSTLVNLTALEQSTGLSVQFNPASVVPGGTATVSVAVSSFAAVGNYTITLLAVSGSINHKVTLQVNVIPGPIQAIYFLIPVAALVLVAVLVVVRYRRKHRRREAALEELIRQASTDTGYVATARAIARLEELRAMSRVDEATYLRLRKEYEKRLEKSK